MKWELVVLAICNTVIGLEAAFPSSGPWHFAGLAAVALCTNVIGLFGKQMMRSRDAKDRASDLTPTKPARLPRKRK